MQRGDPHEEQDQELTLAARRIVDSNQYMTLATADGEGHPWASPVWFAHEEYIDFFWVSRPEARHSRNLASRPELGIVIFDSTVPVGGALAVYLEARAQELDGSERERGLAVFSKRSGEHGAGEWREADVIPPARHRLYRARASEHFILDANDQRIPVRLTEVKEIEDASKEGEHR